MILPIADGEGDRPQAGGGVAEAVEASLALAADRAGDIGPQVYARLFACFPDMEAEFWRDRSGAIRGEMLARALEALLDWIGPRAWSPAYLSTEATTHDSYGIPRAVFGAFYGVVAEVVRDAAGDGWTDAMAEGWAAVMDDLECRDAAG